VVGRHARELIVLLLLAACLSCARAHDPGLSALALRVEQSSLKATLSLSRGDVETLLPLDTNHDGRVTAAEFAAARPALEELMATALEVELDGHRVTAADRSVDLDASDAIQGRLTFPCLARGQLRICFAWFSQLPRGHRQFVSLRDAQDRLLEERMLDVNKNVFETRVAPASATMDRAVRSMSGFIPLGLEHILKGWDHLAFLLGLLLVGGSLREVIKLITAFTVAHSITLALTTLEVIRLRSSIVEPLIAASIVFVGVENIVRHDLKGRWLLAFAFGLIHGCGFASALRDLGLGANGVGVMLPLLSFNLGVELGQLAIAAIALPLIWRLKNWPPFQPRLLPICSAVVALAGAYWLAERTLWG
jgi:hydrogenase/urease accessory protein HupE